MLQPAVSTACLYPMLVEDALYELAVSGVGNVEIFLNTYSEMQRAFIDNLARILERFDMKCLSLHPFTSEIAPMMLFSNYSRRMQDTLDFCKQYFEGMQRLGAKIFVVHGDKCPVSVVNRERNFEHFYKLIELGKSYGITVAQENVARCTSSSLEYLKDMKQALGKDAAFVLDIKQAVRSKLDPMQILDTLQGNIVHVHISDHGTYGDCMLLGKGNFPLETFLKKLAGYNPNCGVVLELYRSGFQNVHELVSNYNLLSTKIKNLGLS